MFTVTNETPHYTSPLIGNGEITTTIGSTGYHNGNCPNNEHVNRTLFWAGRRMNTSTHALVRFGSITRTLSINDQQTADDQWQQIVDYDGGQVVTRLDHGNITEETQSLVCLTANVVIFRTTLKNTGDSANVQFTLTYSMPASVESRLQFPFMSHFDFRPDYQSQDSNQILTRVLPLDDNFKIQYQINAQLGEVRVGWSGETHFEELDSGGSINHELTLASGAEHEIYTWIMLSDRKKYSHFPYLERVQALLNEHQQAWSDFWQTSNIEIGNQAMEALRQTALYTIRSNASPWSIPPAYLATHWEGRTFHDEMYPFLGLMSSGHAVLAARIPHFRLGTLDIALARSGYQGTLFPWETLESGEEGGPYGHWMDERFHIGQFAVNAWQYYLYTRETDALSRLFPLIDGCAEAFVHDVLIRDVAGHLKTRLITDFDEAVYPLENGIFTICSAIYTLETAVQAAEILDVKSSKRQQWGQLATELRTALPIDTAENFYKVSDDGNHWHIAQVGMIFPFSIDSDSETAQSTLTKLTDALRTDVNATAGSPPSYDGTHWLWAASLLSTAFFLQGRADEGMAMLSRVPAGVGAFFAPNEQKVTKDNTIAYRLPWFTTSAGAYVYAFNAMCVHVTPTGTVLLKGVPDDTEHLKFNGIMGTHGVRVSGQVKNGKLIHLDVKTQAPMKWQFDVPTHFAAGTSFSSNCEVTPGVTMTTVVCDLTPGENTLV